MDKSEWLNDIESTQLPEPYREISVLIGVPLTVKFAFLYQGTGLYFPKLDAVICKLRDAKMKEEFDGGNYKQLAIKYGITERWAREIIDKDIDTSQTDMFNL